ncbi:MAG TPA: porin family protein [Cytophagaceae bacterium]|jgi:hypothetical protein|nr:porin family protein [Cytophagaceae bacterium]
MRKIFIAFSLLLCMSTTVQAQETSVGITAGFGHSWLSNQDGKTLFHPAFNFGGTFIYSTVTHWGFGFDVKYSREGNRVRYSPSDNKVWNNLDYVRIPIRVTYFFNNLDRKIRPKISLAPTMGFLAAAHYIAEDNNGHEYANVSNKDNVNGFDFGIAGAIGVNFRVSERMWFTTELAYYNGFANVSKNGSTALNRNASINLGLTYGIGK